MGVAKSLEAKGKLEATQGHIQQARNLLVEARTAYEEVADAKGEAETLTALGELEGALGCEHNAREDFKLASRIYGSILNDGANERKVAFLLTELERSLLDEQARGELDRLADGCLNAAGEASPSNQLVL